MRKAMKCGTASVMLILFMLLQAWGAAYGEEWKVTSEWKWKYLLLEDTSTCSISHNEPISGEVHIPAVVDGGIRVVKLAKNALYGMNELTKAGPSH